MTWDAFLFDVVETDHGRTFRFTMTNGVVKHEAVYGGDNPDNAAVEQFLRNEASRLDSAAEQRKVTYSVGDKIDLAPLVQPAPPPDPMAAFNVASSRLRQLRLYADGVSSPSLDQAIADAVKAKQAAWQDGFL